MASILKKPKSPYWYAAFTGPNGERIQRSTKQKNDAKNRTNAMQMAIDWERLAASGRHRTITEAQARKVVSDILEKSIGEKLVFHTCRAWLTEWLASKKGAVAFNSYKRYSFVIKSFLKYMGARADLTLAAISPKDIRGYRDFLMTGRSATTINNNIQNVLPQPFTAALNLGLITLNPCASVPPLKSDKLGARDVFTPAQIAALLRAADDEWRGAVLCGYFTGLRLRDVTHIRWENIDLAKQILTVTTQKTDTALLIPIHPQFGEWLAKQTKREGYVMPGLQRRSPEGWDGLSKRFVALMEKAGVKGRPLRTGEGTGRKTTSLSFHCLRHSFVSALANAGVPAETRKLLSGHADDKTHDAYTHVAIERLHAAMAKLPAVS